MQTHPRGAMNENTCSLEAIDGSKISRSKSVFSYNSRYELHLTCVPSSTDKYGCAVFGTLHFCCRCISAACEDHVRVYSVGTGELLHTLRRHEAQVTGICMHPKNPQQVCCVSVLARVCVRACACVCVRVCVCVCTYVCVRTPMHAHVCAFVPHVGIV